MSSLRPGHTYQFRLACTNRVGWSPWSAPSDGVSTLVSRPDEPMDVEAEAATPSSIALRWRPPAFDGGALVTQYDLEWAEADCASTVAVDAGGDGAAVVLLID